MASGRKGGVPVGLFDRKVAKVKKEEPNGLLQYTGMRLEVMNYVNGGLLFVGRSSFLWDGSMVLQPITVAPEDLSPEGVRVKMRGFQEEVKKAVHMQCRILPFESGGFLVKELEITGKDNDRAFYRQDTAASGEVVPIRQQGLSEATCHLVNISAGGVCFLTASQYKVGDRLLLKTDLLPGRDAPLVCQVRRATRKRFGFEYGCEFTALDQATEDLLSRAIMEMQRKRMSMERS